MSVKNKGDHAPEHKDNHHGDTHGSTHGHPQITDEETGEAKMGSGLLGGMLFPIIGIIILIFLIVKGCDGCSSSEEEVSTTQTQEIPAPAPRPEMQMSTRWFSDFPNERMQTYLSKDYGVWRSHPRLRSGEEGIPVLVIEWEENGQKRKIIDIAGRNISSPWEPPNNQCSIVRPALPGEYDPKSGERPAQGIELNCYTCSTEYCP